MYNKKTIIKNLISVIVFLSILCFLFVKLTWIMRGNGINTRQDIVGFKNEENIDVVLIGGSTVVRYFQPLEAWNQEGFTSYDYATSAAKVDMFKYYCEDARKTNDAKLYVFDIRTLLEPYEINDTSIRNWSDSISPLSLNRMKGVSEFLFSRNWKENELPSFFLDIIKYHGEYSNLGSEENWEYTNLDNIYNRDKGFEPYTFHVRYDTPCPSDERTVLTKDQSHALNLLLDYCDKESIPALFIVCPYVVQDEQWGLLNTAGDIIKDRGYDFVNFNLFYQDMGLDFEQDFADINHVNYQGSLKYTSYLSHYLSNNYDLPDHRGDNEYRGWHNDYSKMAEQVSKWDRDVTIEITNYFSTLENDAKLRSTEDFDEWYHLYKQNYNNYTTFVVSTKSHEWNETDYSLLEFLNDYNISLDSQDFFSIKVGTEAPITITDSSATGNLGNTGGLKEDVYAIDTLLPSIKINSTEYLLHPDELTIIVYNNNAMTLTDNIYLTYNKGKITVNR